MGGERIGERVGGVASDNQQLKINFIQTSGNQQRKRGGKGAKEWGE